MNRDSRGAFTELFREDWGTGFAPVQWNSARSVPGTVRGVHCHVVHTDYVLVLEGQGVMGLRDLRAASATSGRSVLVPMSGEELSVLTIPPGVAHGFCFPTGGIFLAGHDRHYDPNDELGCDPLDPDLGLAWPVRDPIISERDGQAQPLSGLIAELAPFQPL